MTLRLASLAFVFAVSLTAAPIHAQTPHAGDIHVGQAYARASMPGQTSGGAYVSLENTGAHADALIAAQSPAATSMEIHTMSMEGNVMRMREVDGIELAGGQKIVMGPGKGYHLMLMGLKTPLKAGDRIPVTLTFRKAGKIDTTFEVRDARHPGGGMENGHHHH